MTAERQALINFSEYLEPPEFARLVALMKDVAPSVIYAVAPRNISAMRQGDRAAIRHNLELVLYGAETDQPLFSQTPVPVQYPAMHDV
jgi:hypothetical protein